MELTIFLIGALIVSIGLSGFGLAKLSSWKTRDFGTLNINWTNTFLASSGISFAVGALVFMLLSNPWVAISIIPLAYMMALGTVTDMKILKIPSDISILAYLIPIPIMLLSIDSYGWFSFAVWAGIILLFTVFAFAGAFGVADLRIMILAGTSLVWWAGIETVMLAFGMAAFIQLLIHPLAVKFDWGVVRERKNINDQVQEREKAEYEALSDEEKTDLAEKKALLIQARVAKNKKRSKLARKLRYLSYKRNIMKKRKRYGKPRRFVPFGPALYISFCLGALVYSNMFAVYISPQLSRIGL